MPVTPDKSSKTRALLIPWGFWTAIGLLNFAYKYLDDVARATGEPLLEPLVEEMTAAYAVGLLFYPVRAFARRYPLTRTNWTRHLGPHAGALLLFSVTHTTMNGWLREIFFPLAGLGDYDYGILSVRYLMEFPSDVLVYGIVVAGVYAFDHYQATCSRELATAHLETRLSQAQLQNLRLQLQPHFLFNALNTVSSTMYDDPKAADEMLSRLSELLRLSLRTAHHQEVPLAMELEALDHYVTLMRARFGDRLTVAVDVEPGATDDLVPSLLLQPLVENAVRHGNTTRLGTGHVAVRAGRRDGKVTIEVEDDGPGVPPGWKQSSGGVGLAATAERLRLLYGAGHAFSAGNGSRGFLVCIAIPVRRGGAPLPEPQDAGARSHR